MKPLSQHHELVSDGILNKDTRQRNKVIDIGPQISKLKRQANYISERGVCINNDEDDYEWIAMYKSTTVKVTGNS